MTSVTSPVSAALVNREEASRFRLGPTLCTLGLRHE